MGNLVAEKVGVTLLVSDLWVLAGVRHVDVLAVYVGTGDDDQPLPLGCLAGVDTLLCHFLRRHRVKRDGSVVLELRRDLKVDGNNASSR